MLYDPVTREFKPRESRAPKPQPADGPANEPAPVRPQPTEEGRKRRAHRWTDLRRHRRQREWLAWLMFVLFAGGLIFVTVWVWGKSRHNTRHNPERVPINRLLQSFTE